jgi:hypothetical protein
MLVRRSLHEHHFRSNPCHFLKLEIQIITVDPHHLAGFLLGANSRFRNP